ncbi:MAG: PAS domain S-box protein [Magnetococcales bacterium]|nr:PAS domain S-box protein [Magnetococcales bacterium]
MNTLLSTPTDTRSRADGWTGMGLKGCLLLALIGVSFKNYLLFHILAEFFSIVIAFTFFVIAWNGRRFFDNNYLLFLGISFLFIGFLDLIHTLGYKGMGIFERQDANLATQLWIGARYLESVSFVAAFFFIRRRVSVNGLLLLYGMVTGLILLSIFAWDLFPDCWVDGQGLTSFKKNSEYAIGLILLSGLILLHRQQDQFAREILRLLRWALIATMGSELAFTFYVDTHGLSNLLGHLLKITAFYCLYKAVAETTLVTPIKVLYYNITSTRDALATANQELCARQLQLEMAQEIAQLGYWHWEIASGRFIWSKEIFRIFGLDPDKAPPSYDTFLRSIPEPERQQVMQGIHQALTQPDTPYQAEHPVVRPDGSVCHVLARGAVIRDEQGQAVTMFGTVLDLTKRHQVEKQIRILSQAVEQSPSSIVMTDRDGVIQYVNHSFIMSSGYSREELLGQDPSLLKSGITPQQVYQDLWQTITSGRVWRGDLCNRRKNGELFWELANISPIRDQDGNISHFLGIKDDITDKKRLEEEKQQALDRAEQASRAKSEFLATMSHEIRTPMNGVLGMAELILGTPLTPQQRHYVETIHRSGHTLLCIINDILDFSKIQAGHLGVDILRFELDEVIQDVCGLLADKARAKGLSFDMHMADGVPLHLLGDPYRLNQILFNLVGNAIKFTSAGSVQVQVQVLTQREADVLLRFQVTDTGIGITPEFHNRLFQAFSQEDPSISRRFGGTGLGLAITHRLVSLMNGELHVTSQPEQGSTFWFTLRFGLQQPGDRELISSWQAQHRPITPDHFQFKGRILLVEDNPINQEVAMATLELFGCQVTVANNGQQAITCVHEATTPFDLVFMDCEMPILDGFETTRKLRQWELEVGHARTPIVALTAHVLQESRQQCTDAGMDDYLRKPFRQTDMGSLLDRWLPRVTQGQDERARDEKKADQSAATMLSHQASRPSAPETPPETLLRPSLQEPDRSHASMPPMPPILDPTALELIRELTRKRGNGLLEKMVEHYLMRTPELLTDLEAAAQANDSRQVRFAAHSLKSTSVTIGATRMVELGRIMESRHTDFALVGHSCQLGRAAFVEVREALNALIANPDANPNPG